MSWCARTRGRSVTSSSISTRRATPVMVEPDQGVTLIGSQPIVEYFDETVNRMPMIHGNAVLRAEIRRMTEWFESSSIVRRSSL